MFWEIFLKNLSDNDMLDTYDLVRGACFLFINFTRYDLNQTSEERKGHMILKKKEIGDQMER